MCKPLIWYFKKYNQFEFCIFVLQMKTIQKISSISLAVIFLLSSLGFTANKMVCLKSGKTKIAFTHFKDCCSNKNAATPLVKSTCCAIQNSDFQLLDHSISGKNNVPSAKYFATFNSFLTTCAFKQSNNFVSFSYVDLPPLLPGRQLLFFISVLNIWFFISCLFIKL